MAKSNKNWNLWTLNKPVSECSPFMQFTLTFRVFVPSLHPFLSQESEPAVHSLNMHSIKLCTDRRFVASTSAAAAASASWHQIYQTFTSINPRTISPPLQCLIWIQENLKVPSHPPLPLKIWLISCSGALEAASSLCLSLWASWLS